MPKPKKASVKKKVKVSRSSKRKGGGGKLSRSEIVQVRLDPKLKFAVELAARKHRRTISSFIEWAVDQAVNETAVGLKKEESAWSVTNSVWDIDEADRFVNLAHNYPNILTHDEGVLWKRICEYFVLWQAPWDKGKECDFRNNSKHFDLRYLRQGFDGLKNFAKGEINEEELIDQFAKMTEQDPEYRLAMKMKGKRHGSKI